MNKSIIKKYSLLLLFLIILLSSCEQFNNSKNIKIASYFSPNIKDVLIGEIRKAKSTIDIAIYVFTDKDIVDVLNKKADEGIKIRILFGKTADNFSSSVDESINAKIEKRRDGIHKFEFDGIMHNKFMIVDGKVLVTGSYNWTYSANRKNNENIMIINNAQGTVNNFQNEFKRIWEKGEIIKVIVIEGIIDINKLSEVKRYVGSYITGEGIVKSVGYSKRSGTYYLNFGARGKSFTIVMFKRVASEYKSNRGSIFSIKGKRVRCRGKVKYFKKYGYEIILNNYKDLEILND